MATVESFSGWRLKREPFVRAKEVLNGKLPTKLISNFLLHFKIFLDKANWPFTLNSNNRFVFSILQSIVHQPPHISGSDPVINFFHPLPEDLIELDHDQAE